MKGQVLSGGDPFVHFHDHGRKGTIARVNFPSAIVDFEEDSCYVKIPVVASLRPKLYELQSVELEMVGIGEQNIVILCYIILCYIYYGV